MDGCGFHDNELVEQGFQFTIASARASAFSLMR
jgi:hypothetical protein